MVFGFLGGGNKGSRQSENNEKTADTATASTSASAKSPGFQCTPGATCLVTGSSGLCGARLVEMLLERGAHTVICFDLATPSAALQQRFETVQKETGGKLILCHGPQDGNLTDPAAVERAFASTDNKIDVVYHIAALVGPFHDKELYHAVNYVGTLTIIDMCRKYKVPKLVYSSSPSTRFTGADVEGATEDELPFPDKWLAEYAATKAKGEMEVAKACGDELLTISVAPHQIYGPHDNLFLPNLLETAGNGRLRIFGSGRSIISVCYVDNYAHGLMCGADALAPGSTVLGKFYIITDGKPVKFWDFINQAIVAMGFVDLTTKFHLPVWLLYAVAYVANVLGLILGKKFKLNPFNVRMLTMHRYFSLEHAQRDLHFTPVVDQSVAWPATIEWFKQYWLPGFLAKTQNRGTADSTTGTSKKTA